MSEELPAYRPNDLGAGLIFTPSESAGGGVYYNRRLRLSLRNYIEIGARLELTQGQGDPSPLSNPIQGGLPPNWSSVTFKEKFGLTPVARLGHTWFLPWEESQHGPLGFGLLFEGAYSSRWGEVRGVDSQNPNQPTIVSRDIQNQGWRLRGGGQLVGHFLFSTFLRAETGVAHAIDSFGSRTGVFVFIGIGYLFGLEGKVKRRQPPSDRDGDGVVDSLDACPDTPGISTNDPRTNGCPLPPPDRDRDLIPDAEDACPDVPGVKTQDPQTNGCPPDRDRDGIPDSEDYCPDVPGIKSDDPKKNGCPVGSA